MNQALAIPRATYRLQLHAGFTFRDAAAVVPYLADLGISHIYCSPYLKARRGSTHGYDIVDHQNLNPEIGTREDFDHLAAVLERHGMGQILDMVPNHMGVMGADNAWWLDVLENGRSSPYADFFDIDWQPPNAHLHNKVLVPVLGDHYGACLDRGELVLCFAAEAGTFHVTYFDHRFPLDARSYAAVLERAARKLEEDDDSSFARVAAMVRAFLALPHRDEVARDEAAQRHAAQQLCKRQLADLVRECSSVHKAISEAVDSCNGSTGDGFDSLHELLELQAYRLAYWRVASDEINYRRFFDINELAALRMENEAAFEATHRFVFQLVRQGAVHGLRIDHPDGLFDPAGYFRRLQETYASEAADQAGERLYVVAEKIIARFEDLPEDWMVHGTTGYRFANLVNGLFVDARSEKRFSRIYAKFSGNDASFGDIAEHSRRMVLRNALAGDLTVLAGRLHRIAQADRLSRDYTLNTLRVALADVIVVFPVYRTYVSGRVSASDRRYVEWAVALAKRRNHATEPGIFDFVGRILLCEVEGMRPELADEVRHFARKFQQLTAPVMAKGVEDTSFYVYNRLLSLNDVGGDPAEFGIGVSAFHGASTDRAARWPHTLLATSTHDNKRSEDVRMRINVLAEAPAAWRMHLARWARMNRSRKTRVAGQPAPSRNDEYLIYQVLVGSLPAASTNAAALENYRERILAYAAKAAREAKVHTSWTNPDVEYEAALGSFVRGILEESGRNLFLADLRQVSADVVWFGALNSLSMLLIKLTSPGVPDIYQGNELFDFSLVDPDNRRPVDYALRAGLLRELRALESQGGAPAVLGQMAAVPTGEWVKLYFTWKLLALRRQWPRLFMEGDYTPLVTEGERSVHVVSYARRRPARGIVAIGGRLFTGLASRDSLPCGEKAWGNTVVRIPFLQRGARLIDQLSGRTHEYDGEGLRMSAAWADFPGSVLWYEQEEHS
jgi:(1->4)-alpha-D-glucan 1-alpha-D-glucosylmutase